MKGGEKVNRDEVPEWILALDKESLEFIRKFILNSGSLKEISKIYGVSYPTVRTKLDKLIKKIELNSKKEDVEFVSMINKPDQEQGLETVRCGCPKKAYSTVCSGSLVRRVFYVPQCGVALDHQIWYLAID